MTFQENYAEELCDSQYNSCTQSNSSEDIPYCTEMCDDFTKCVVVRIDWYITNAIHDKLSTDKFEGVM